MARTKTENPLTEIEPQSVTLTAELESEPREPQTMKSYEQARADVAAGRVIEFDSLEELKAYAEML